MFRHAQHQWWCHVCLLSVADQHPSCPSPWLLPPPTPLPADCLPAMGHDDVHCLVHPLPQRLLGGQQEQQLCRRQFQQHASDLGRQRLEGTDKETFFHRSASNACMQHTACGLQLKQSLTQMPHNLLQATLHWERTTLAPNIPPAPFTVHCTRHKWVIVISVVTETQWYSHTYLLSLTNKANQHIPKIQTPTDPHPQGRWIHNNNQTSDFFKIVLMAIQNKFT